MTRRRKLVIAGLAGATVIWLLQVVAPVADVWLARAARQVEGVRPFSYFERRDPALCADDDVGRGECVRQAIRAQRDWAAARRALWQAAWDLDLMIWSTLLNLGVGLAPLLLVLMNGRRTTAEPTNSELF